MKIAIASGKGGTGKTTVAVNLASFLAQNQKITLVDLDVEEPNSGLFIKGELQHKEDKFKMIPRWEKATCIQCGNCQKVCNFNAVMKLDKLIMIFPELCHSCYACSELCPVKALPMQTKQIGKVTHSKIGDLDFIEGKLLIGEEQAVPLIKQTIQYVEQNSGIDQTIIFDAPPGTSCPVIEVTREADLILLVTEPTPFGLHDLKLAVDTMEQLGKAYGVIINRAGLGNAAVKDYCLGNKIPLVAEIPNQRRIAEEYSSGNLLYQLFPALKEQLVKINSYICQKQQELQKCRK